MKRTLLALTLIVASVGTANAYGTSTPGIDGRQANQENRIRDGIRDGSLTRSEAGGLIQEQRRIQQLESRAKSDGYISARERNEIRRAQENASRHIYQERHDSEVSKRRRWW
jgi:hypothetical protein